MAAKTTERIESLEEKRTKAGEKFSPRTQWKTGFKWKLSSCPFDRSHTKACVTFASGYGFSCFQCAGAGQKGDWSAFKAKIGIKTKAYPKLPGLTVEQYAAAKKLPKQLLQERFDIADGFVPPDWLSKKDAEKGVRIPCVWWTYENSSKKFRWGMGKSERRMLTGHPLCLNTPFTRKIIDD